MNLFVMKCVLCLENYSGDRVPRNLVCGHSLCTPCAGQFLSGHRRCPECQEKQFASSVTELPVNYPLMRLIRSNALEEADINGLRLPVFPGDIPPAQPQEDVWACAGHGSPIVFLCCRCNTWVCEDCLVTDHPVPPRGTCNVIGPTEAADLMRTEHQNIASSILKEMGALRRDCEFHNDILNHCAKQCPDNQVHSHLISRIRIQVEEFKRDNESVADLAGECVRKSTQALSSTSSPETATTIYNEFIRYRDKVMGEMLGKQERMLDILHSAREHMKLDLKMLADKKANVFTVMVEEGKSRWAHITTVDDNLLLNCLNEGTPPKEGISIPFGYVRKLVPDEYTSVFFEVGTAGEKFGHVYIRFNTDIPLTRQFTLLCSGEKGVSYKGTRFYEYNEREGRLSGGDYENNNGTGGQPLLSVYRGRSGIFRAGTLICDSQRTTFSLCLLDLAMRSSSVVGWVTEGLEVLQAASQVTPITDSVIRNCGLVIPIEESEH